MALLKDPTAHSTKPVSAAEILDTCSLEISIVKKQPTQTFSYGRRSKGFTLLEVMVALLIFGLVATVIQKATSQTLVQYEHIRLKTLANWIAENKMAEIRLSGSLPPTRETKEDLEYANERWKIVSKVIKTEDVNMNRVELEVFNLTSNDQFDEGNKLLSYSGFVGRY